ncbi:leukocyte elastase inhibitor A-like [Neosynchiropus ocellatus]
MAQYEKISKANTTFSVNLLKKISEDEKTSNIFFSGFSISAALSMLMSGTGGNTHKQMSEVLCFTEADNPDGSMQTLMQEKSPMRSQMQTRLQMRMQIQQSSRLPPYLLKCMKPDSVPDVLHEDFSKLLKELQQISSLKLANRLYGDKSFEFLQGFLKETEDKYGAELEPVDFKGEAEEARVHINGWVEKNTDNKIEDLLAEGTVDASTVLVLVNAIYFKDKWSQQFNKEDTVDAPFRINKNDTKTVKMMRQKSQFRSAQIPEQQIQILEMPYVEGGMSMIILLPDDVEDDTTGLEKLEKELTYGKLFDWMNLMSKYEVQVQVPQFKLEQTYQMNDILISMGMVDAFDVSKSNFCRMSTANNLVVSTVVHKAFLVVDEEGTEAAAATGVVVSERSAAIPHVFNADHPFLFLIVHEESKSVLFAGRFCNPE